MVFLGKYNCLKVIKIVEFGVYLNGENLGEILLPGKYLPEECKVGDKINVFLYNDSDDRIIATTEKPHTEANKFAFLKVISVESVGAFLDWGLSKDLLIPYREQASPMEPGKYYIVYTYLDNESLRIVASTKLNKFLDHTFPDYTEGEETNILIAEKTDLGYKVIVNNLHWGLIFHSDIFTDIHPGEQRKGYIKKVREDDKIDISLFPPGFQKSDESSKTILQKLKQNNGFMPLHDKSPTGSIYSTFGMSKKTFKTSIGNLYKKKIISIKEDGIYLIKD
jgi:predicted RNA-binding protein (virulence factor B family)